jgi:hypothetical protein
VYVIALYSQFMCRNWRRGRRRHDGTRAQVELCEMQWTLDDALLDPPFGKRIGVVSASVIEAIHVALAEENRHWW